MRNIRFVRLSLVQNGLILLPALGLLVSVIIKVETCFLTREVFLFAESWRDEKARRWHLRLRQECVKRILLPPLWLLVSPIKALLGETCFLTTRWKLPSINSASPKGRRHCSTDSTKGSSSASKQDEQVFGEHLNMNIIHGLCC